MIPNPADDPPTPRRPGRFQYRLSFFFVLMFAVGALSAGVAGLVHQGTVATVVPGELYVVMLTAAPLGAMIVLSLFYAVQHWLGKRPPSDDSEPPEPP